MTTRIGETLDRVDELSRLVAQLRSAAARLGAEPTDGPCGPGCACLVAAATDADADADAGDADLRVVPDPGRAPAGEVPVACTLPAGGVDERAAEWADLLAHVTGRSRTPDGALRLALGTGTPIDDLVRLVTAEQGCCGFLSFAITVDGRGTALEVRAPEEAAPMVDLLFGRAT